MGGPLFYIVFDSNCFQVALFLTFSRLASGGPTFGRPKVGGKTAGETPGPLLLPNRTPAKEYCAATETPRFGWLLVIGLVGHLLRLSALVLLGTSGRAKRIDSSSLFKRATAEVG